MKNRRPLSNKMMCLGLAALASLAVADPATAATGSFTGLGFLNPSFPTSTNPYVDADGTVVAGTSNYTDSLTEAFVWTLSDGMTGLGFVKRTNETAAGGINGNGKVVAGTASGTENGDIPETAFLWSSSTGIGMLNDKKAGDTAVGTSKNGSVVVGDAGDGSYRWIKGQHQAEFLGILGAPEGQEGLSIASGTDFSGDYVVGFSTTTTTGQLEAYLWNDGMRGLGFPPSDNLSYAEGISGDSTTVVGYGRAAGSEETTAFYWTTLGGIQALSGPTGLPYTIANAVSNNGSVIVGCATASTTEGTGDQAVMWNSQHVPKTIASIAAKDGISITGWTLTCATSISAGGKTIVGNGIDPNGHNQAWLLQLP